MAGITVLFIIITDGTIILFSIYNIPLSLLHDQQGFRVVTSVFDRIVPLLLIL